MAGKEIKFTVPLWTANLLPNLLGLAGLVAICFAVAALTDWRWGLLAGGIFAVVLASWVQMSPPATASNVRPIKRAAA